MNSEKTKNCLVCGRPVADVKVKEQGICNLCIEKNYSTSDKAVIDNMLHRTLKKYNGKVPNRPMQDAAKKDVATMLNDLGVKSDIRDKVMKNLDIQLGLMYNNMKRYIDSERKRLEKKGNKNPPKK